MASSTAAATLLVQVVDRRSMAALTAVEERILDRRPGESDTGLERRMKEIYHSELLQRRQFVPDIRRKLAGKDWFIDCTVV